MNRLVIPPGTPAKDATDAVEAFIESTPPLSSDVALRLGVELFARTEAAA